MVPLRNKRLRMYLIILVLSNILFSTMAAAFRTTKSTSIRHVTLRTTSSATAVSAAMGIKSDKTTTSAAASDKTGSTSGSKSISESSTNPKALKETTAGVTKPLTTPKPTTVSVVQVQSIGTIPQMSSKTTERFSTSPFTKVTGAGKSFTSSGTTIKPLPTYKPISLENKIPASEQLNVSAVIGRKMLSVTTNGLSSSIPSPSKNVNVRTTAIVTKTTAVPATLKAAATSTHSKNGASVTKISIKDSTLSGRTVHTLAPSSTKVNVQVTRSSSKHDLYKSTNGNKNTPETVTKSTLKGNNVNNNPHNLGVHNDPLATVPGSHNKDKGNRTIDIKHSSSHSTLKSLTTPSKLISSPTVPPKDNNSRSTSKSTFASKSFVSSQQATIPVMKNTISTNKLIFETATPVTKTSHSVKPTTPSIPIATTIYTTIVSSKEVTTEGMHSAEVNNSTTNKPENGMNPSSRQFSDVLMLLGTTAAPTIGPSDENSNTELYRTTSSEISAFSPLVLSPQTINMINVTNSSLPLKEGINEHEPTFNSTYQWQHNFIGMLRTMFEHYKGNNNIIIVPISIINNSGNVYLMDKNQGSQFSVGETVTHSSAKDLTDSENDAISTTLTHLSTATPSYIFEKSTKLRETEAESNEKLITQKKKNNVYEIQDNVDSTEFVSRGERVNHSRRKESHSKADETEMEQKENVMKETIKPINNVGTISPRNWHSESYLHENDELYDPEDVEPQTQTNAMIERKTVIKTVTPGMKTLAKENGRIRSEQRDYENISKEDTEYPTRTLNEAVHYKLNFRDRKSPFVMEEEISRSYNRRIPQTTGKTWDDEDFEDHQNYRDEIQ